MFAQPVPIGINITSPVTWFVIAIAGIVLALTLSTRRGNTRPREPAIARAGSIVRDADGWAAAQALFVESPRAGLERAQAIVTRTLRDHGAAGISPDTQRLHQSALAIAANPHATTEELRRALLDFRRVLDELGAHAG